MCAWVRGGRTVPERHTRDPQIPAFTGGRPPTYPNPVEKPISTEAGRQAVHNPSKWGCLEGAWRRPPEQIRMDSQINPQTISPAKKATNIFPHEKSQKTSQNKFTRGFAIHFAIYTTRGFPFKTGPTINQTNRPRSSKARFHMAATAERSKEQEMQCSNTCLQTTHNCCCANGLRVQNCKRLQRIHSYS